MSESEPRRWLAYADEDLQTARVELELDLPARHPAFLAQQAAEKAIKACILAAGGTFPYTHDLPELIALVPPGWQVAQTDADLERLTEFAGRPRYPDPAYLVDEADAAKAVEDAKAVVDAARADLDREGA